MRDAIIIGGGPAGAALAIQLAQAGRDILLIERSATSRGKVCGEFLSGEALVELHRLGLDVLQLGGAPIGSVCMAAGERSACTTLPFAAAGLPRRILDEALLARAAECGAEIHRGQAVNSATAQDIQTDRPIAARMVILATGKHEFRGRPRPVPRHLPRWTGLRWHLPTQSAEAQVALHWLPNGYAGLQPSGPNTLTLCMALRDARQGWQQAMQAVPPLHALLQQAGWPRPRAIAGVPYGYLHAAPDDGLFRIGDQYAVIPSFCGDGVAIALHSARRAAAAILAGLDATGYHAALRRELAPQFRRAAWMSRAAAWPPGPGLFVAAARIWPGLLRSAATGTRIPVAS